MHGEIRDDLKTQNIPEEGVSPEKQQEILLMNKMAAGGKLPPKSQSVFLQKKLQQRKFFDSGDYAMNQNKEKKQLPPGVLLPQATAVVGVVGQKLEQTATSVKTPILQSSVIVSQDSKLDEPIQQQQSLRLPNMPSFGGSVDGVGADFDEESHLQIPRPDTVPQRKASILHPSVHSKLSPQPHIHHDKNDDLIAAPPE